MINTYKQCPICLEGRVNDYKIKARSFIDTKPLFFGSCDHCGSLVSQPIDRNNLYKDRSSSNYSHGQGVISFLKKNFLSYLLLRHIPKNSQVIIDFGCGAGEVSNMLAERRKAKIFAVDLLPDRPGGLKKSVTYVYSENLHQVPQADIFIARHVLEHLDDFNIALHDIYSVIQVGGIVICEVPNVKSPFRSLLGSCWPGYFVPYHTVVFSSVGLVVLFARHGFDIVKVAKVNTPVLGSFLMQFGFPRRLSRTLSVIAYPAQALLSMAFGEGDSQMLIFKKR